MNVMSFTMETMIIDTHTHIVTEDTARHSWYWCMNASISTTILEIVTFQLIGRSQLQKSTHGQKRTDTFYKVPNVSVSLCCSLVAYDSVFDDLRKDRHSYQAPWVESSTVGFWPWLVVKDHFVYIPDAVALASWLLVASSGGFHGTPPWWCANHLGWSRLASALKQSKFKRQTFEGYWVVFFPCSNNEKLDMIYYNEAK